MESSSRKRSFLEMQDAMPGKREGTVVGQGSAAGGESSAQDRSLVDYPMENDWEYVHGRVNPGVDENVHLVEGLPVKEYIQEGWQKVLDHPVGKSSAVVQPGTLAWGTRRTSLFTSLPSELIDHVLSFLGPFDLTILSGTCRCLSSHSRSDLAWQRHVQSNIPGLHLTSPAPYSSFRELYIAHDPNWFLPKYKIWFSDYFLTGKLIITRYDPRRAVIEGYRLVAERPPPSFDTWAHDDEVVIHSFDPKCRLHLDEPALQLNPRAPSDFGKKWNAEMPMSLHARTQRTVFTNFILTRAVEERPNMALWPPPTIPAEKRVRNASQEGFSGTGHKPQLRDQICDTSFRIRRWIQMAGGRTAAPGVHMGEEISTFSTLDPRLYTPTEEKPYRGIWVGDYSGHGCEFLLMHQPDEVEPFDPQSVEPRRRDESKAEWEKRVREARIYRGRLEAIKLTGDPNIPRGEHTFIADDIGANGFVRVATEEPFKGARVVESRGHIAARMFTNDKYISSQLILLSPNRLAQYWVGFGHISYFERVDMDSFLTPPSSSFPSPADGIKC